LDFQLLAGFVELRALRSRCNALLKRRPDWFEQGDGKLAEMVVSGIREDGSVVEREW
jgi:hypothetical protein